MTLLVKTRGNGEEGWCCFKVALLSFLITFDIVPAAFRIFFLFAVVRLGICLSPVSPSYILPTSASSNCKYGYLCRWYRHLCVSPSFAFGCSPKYAAMSCMSLLCKLLLETHNFLKRFPYSPLDGSY